MKTFGSFSHYQLTSSVNMDHQSSSRESFRVTQSTSQSFLPAERKSSEIKAAL